MPRKINGVRLTAKEHRQWKDVYAQTHNGAIATGVVKKAVQKRASRGRSGK